jgi:hypothetical protein
MAEGQLPFFGHAGRMGFQVEGMGSASASSEPNAAISDRTIDISTFHKTSLTAFLRLYILMIIEI